ncbi:uncharacterized protein CcaverHIS019_0703660 [Cutaneotrichosporon cavernicola]|uniref:Uncharacterized protein n=1 Tax=Cutaneotrichosporon cavernicola TaxID=279322 RepID=A0AA48QYZ2_9TREE|nr:uncharacterized protein CcaverHIS019_0703660 [Cutaneotrichosporon cavernicola]BEI94785.1 hypothetical protein CcaverHIS019_0703660 [Cutaneotrichosporon cavernicola]
MRLPQPREAVVPPSPLLTVAAHPSLTGPQFCLTGMCAAAQLLPPRIVRIAPPHLSLSTRDGRTASVAAQVLQVPPRGRTFSVPNGILRRPGTPSGHASDNHPLPDQPIRQSRERCRANTPAGHRTPVDHLESSERGCENIASADHDAGSDRGRPTDRKTKKKFSAVLKRRGSGVKGEPGVLEKVVNYGSELKERARSRVRRGSNASHRPPPLRSPPETWEEAVTRIGELETSGNEHLINLVLTEERLSRVEAERDVLKEQVGNLLSAEEEVKVLRLQIPRLRNIVLHAQKDSAKANEDARHADAARESESNNNARRIMQLEGELEDVREKWRWLKEHCEFREVYSGFAGQALHDYRAWEAFWAKETVIGEGKGWEEFDAWLRFQEEQEDHVQAALKDALETHRATWEREMVDERATFAAEEAKWETQKESLVTNDAKIRIQIADQMYAQIQKDAAMQVQIDNLTGYLRTSEAEQKRLHADLLTAQETEGRLRSRLESDDSRSRAYLDTARETEKRLRDRLEVSEEVIAGYEARLEAMTPELELEKKKHADYRRAAAGLQRENDKLREEVKRFNVARKVESEDEFHDTLESIPPHAL